MSRKRTLEEFIALANAVHSSTYSYSKSEYINNNTKLTIVCAEHGAWEQTPGNHLSGKGCPHCSGKVKLSTQEFKDKANIVHNYLYNYSKSIYLRARSKVTITCQYHGEFSQRAATHLEGQGCPSCGIEKQAQNSRDTLATFLLKAFKIHKSTYTYKHAVYVSSSEKLLVTCRKHGNFYQAPNHHLQGSGCPQCANYGFSKVLPAILYYFNIKGIYKVGVTNRTVKERYNKEDNSHITELVTWAFSTGEEAHKYEQQIIKLNKEHAYSGPTPFTDGTTTTECFTKDIYTRKNI